jgi:hypothetical protein
VVKLFVFASLLSDSFEHLSHGHNRYAEVNGETLANLVSKSIGRGVEGDLGAAGPSLDVM